MIPWTHLDDEVHLAVLGQGVADDDEGGEQPRHVVLLPARYGDKLQEKVTKI